MANESEEILDLQRRVETLEELVAILRGRIDALDSPAPAPDPDFHMPAQEPTI